MATYTYDYNLDGSLQSVQLNSDQPTTYDYDKCGRVSGVRYPNGFGTQYKYDYPEVPESGTHDGRNLVKIVSHSGRQGTSQTRYEYDAAGNVISWQCTDGTYASYQYDRLNRMDYEELALFGTYVVKRQYAYDTRGNRLSSQDLLTSILTTYEYDADGKLRHSYNPNIDYFYDADGNLVQKTQSGASTYYQYDYDNQLTRITLPDASWVEFIYTGGGERVRRTDSTPDTTMYVHGSGSLLQETNLYGDFIKALYNPGIGQYTAQGVRYSHPDRLGSTNMMSDGFSFTDVIYYDAWGNVVSSPPATQTPFKFVGKQGYYTDSGTAENVKHSETASVFN